MKTKAFKLMATFFVAALTLGFTACGDDDIEEPTRPEEKPGNNEDNTNASIFPKDVKFETYTLERPGQLEELVPWEKKSVITALKIKGPINGTDLRYIREMAGRGVSNNIIEKASLNYLDLSEATIVEGGQFYYNNNLTQNDVLPKDVFSQCKLLKAVAIPNTVTSIGNSAFSGCSGLPSINIPNSVTSIGNSAFSGCSGLTSVHITDLASWCGIKFSDYYANPLYYAHHLYINNKEVTELAIPNSVTSIGYYAFSGCSGLTSINIPNSVTSIGGYAFYGCSGLTGIKVDAGNTTYDSRDNCNAIIETSSNTLLVGCQSSTFPKSVTSIGNSAFSGCSGLTSINIPNSVTSIGNSAFSGCSGLNDVIVHWHEPITIGKTVFSIISDYFHCYYPENLHIPAGTLSAYKNAIGWDVFKNYIEDADNYPNGD